MVGKIQPVTFKTSFWTRAYFYKLSALNIFITFHLSLEAVVLIIHITLNVHQIMKPS